MKWDQAVPQKSVEIRTHANELGTPKTAIAKRLISVINRLTVCDLQPRRARIPVECFDLGIGLCLAGARVCPALRRGRNGRLFTDHT